MRIHIQAANRTTRERGEAARTALHGGTATLAVHVAKRDDGAGRVVKLDALPVHAGRGAVAVALAAGETGDLCVSVYVLI